MNRSTWMSVGVAGLVAGIGGAAFADGFQGPPFDFSDAYYRANGIDPTTLVGRPNGTGSNSVIDNRENGPDLNNVRILDHTGAYDHSGHPIFFYVVGLATPASFLSNSAGQHAMQVAEQYQVYEFPRSTNGQFAVFPKRQDLVADLRNGYFSNDPLGIWRVNIVRYTAAALSTPGGQSALDTIAARNGRDLDGTPLIRTVDEVSSLRSAGYVTVEVPPQNGGAGVIRWFFCPVIKDPRNGVIAPDAHLTATGLAEGLPAAQEFATLFNCLQTTGRDDCAGGHRSDCDHDGNVSVQDIFTYLGWFFGGDARADFNTSGRVEPQDIFEFLSVWFAGV